VVVGNPGDDALYFRAYPIIVEGLALIQLEWLQADPKQSRYQVCRYTLRDGRLFVQTLNDELISDTITDTAELQEALLENCRNPRAFNEPMLYRRMSEK